MNRINKISALGIVYNEEHNIREYLNNMSFADEIILVDSFSSDATMDIIAAEYPHVKVVQRTFDNFSSQRNFTIDLATHDWIVFFDADERVSQKGINEIISVVQDSPEEVAFLCKRVFFYEGRPLINSSFNTDKTVRVFRKSKCRYSEKLVHEQLIINGKTGLLKEPIDHYSFKNKQDFLNKRLQYSRLKAKELHDKGVKTNIYHLTVRPTFRFFKYYILGFGFINGRRGFDIAQILGHHVYMRYIYLNEMNAAAEKHLKILVIQQKMIGDVLASSIICNNLKTMYPQSTIDYLIYPFTQPVVENNPNIDNIILFEEGYRTSKFAFLKFLLGIRKKKYDIVIDAYGIIESNLITAFTFAKKRIGFYKPYTNFLYTDTAKELKTPTTHAGLALENRLLLLQFLEPKIALDPKPKIFITPQEVESGRKLLENFSIDLSKKLYMISALGSGVNKTYPYEYMAKLLDVIVSESDATLIFNYMPSQREEALAIYNLCQPQIQKNIIIEFTPGSVREFISVVYHCSATIGNEGGAVNIAKALEIPTFTIFSTWIKKEAWNSFEDGEKIVSVHLKDFKPEIYGERSPKRMKGQAVELYREFVPELIIPILTKYLKVN